MQTTYHLKNRRLFLSSVPQALLFDLSRFEGRRWHKDLGAWSLPPSLRAINFLTSHNYIPRDDTTTYVSFLRNWQEASSLHPFAGQPRKLGPYVLYPYQESGVQFLEQLPKALLYDAPGVGKTLQAVAWAENAETCLVVAPKAVLPQWEGILQDIGKHPIIQPKELRDGQWGVTNYERLSGLTIPLGSVLVADEVHYAKNTKSARSKHLHRLGGRANRILGLTGTPIINRPVELWSIFLLLGERERQEFWPFVQHYCAAYQTQWGWDFSGASNLDDLKDEMLHFSLRRSLEEVAPNLPPKRYLTIPVRLSEADGKEVKTQEQHIAELVSGKALLSSQGLGALQRLRMATAATKSLAVKEWVLDYLNSGGGNVAVFSSFKEPLRNALQELPAVFYTGDESTSERAASLQALSVGSAKVVGLTYGAGGFGLDGLQRTCDTVALLDLPWTPAESEQAENRVHRMGQGKPVQIVRFVCDSYIERKVVEARDKKVDVISYLMEVL